MELREKAIQIATTQIGNEEIPRGSNWGEHVKKYLNSVGLNFPASWCMAFVYWCYNEAAKEFKIANPLTKSAGVLDEWNKEKATNGTKTPQRGDIFIMDFGKGLGHTGIIESVNGTFISTIEGNTNNDGSREGYAVEQKVRKISACKGFLHYAEHNTII